MNVLSVAALDMRRAARAACTLVALAGAAAVAQQPSRASARQFDAPVRDGPLPDWSNPLVVHRNTETPRASFTAYPTEAQALASRNLAPFYQTDHPTDAPWYRSLNGRWKFHFSRRPADRPLDFYTHGYDDRAWDSIPVPANWERQGYGVAIYTDGQPAQCAQQIADNAALWECPSGTVWQLLIGAKVTTAAAFATRAHFFSLNTPQGLAQELRMLEWNRQ